MVGRDVAGRQCQGTEWQIGCKAETLLRLCQGVTIRWGLSAAPCLFSPLSLHAPSSCFLSYTFLTGPC